MRSAEQISRTPSEWAERRREECARSAREALAMIRAARERGDEWIVWLESGRPVYTSEQYAALGGKRKR